MAVTAVSKKTPFTVHQAVSKNRLVGLWRMMTGYRWYYLAAVFFLAVGALSKTQFYLVMRDFVDNVLGQGRFDSTLLVYALGLFTLAATEGLSSFLSGRLAAKTAESITRRLRNALFDHIQHLTFAYHAETQTGDLIQRSTSDVDALRRFYSDQAIAAARIVLLFVINFSAMLTLSPKLAFSSIVVVPVIVLVSAFFFKRVSKAYEAFQEQEAVLSTTLQENLTGVRVVKAFARQDYERNKFETDNKKKYERGKTLAMMHSLFWPISDVICGAQIIIGLFVAASMAISGEITLGTYLAYSALIVWIIFPMRNLGRVIVQMSTGLVSYNRVAEILRQPQEDMDSGDVHPEAGISGEIIFDHVSFEYETGNPVLNDVSFTCKPGQVVALLGSTGSGKSSLVNLLPRFYDATHGMIKLDGVDIKRYPRRFLRQHIGIVEQEPFLFSRSIHENITYGVSRTVTHEEVESAARAAAVHDVIQTFPDEYKTMVGEKGVTLSGGQKQRVAIARTLLKNPRILILDDSTSSVDTETEAEIRTALQELMQNRTTFIIAHRIQSIMTADLILVFDKGEIVQAGTHETLVNQDGIYRRIYEIQTRIETELEEEVACV